MELLGIKFIGASHLTAVKLGLTVASLAALLIVRWIIVAVVRLATRRADSRTLFWTRQISSLVAPHAVSTST